jgi:hypothetical protein
MRASTMIIETRNRIAYLTPLIDKRRINIAIVSRDDETEITGVISISEVIHFLNKNLVIKTVDKEEEN